MSQKNLLTIFYHQIMSRKFFKNQFRDPSYLYEYVRFPASLLILPCVNFKSPAGLMGEEDLSSYFRY